MQSKLAVYPTKLPVPGNVCICDSLPRGADGPPSDTMARCDYCNAHVSDRFARVFADENGRLLACPNCAANVGIAEVSRNRASRS